uniref:Putative peptidase m14-like domain of atp/gtp binding protein n=1 Tax=Anopheles marajoara TaxID=58244 RepID=A0A2M4B8U9_9DIPT
MMIDNYECAGYTFYSKFDSGNLGKVELVRCAEGLGIVGNTVSSVPIGIGTVAGSGSSNVVASISGVPIIGSGVTSGGVGCGVVSNSTITATSSTSASAIVAATLGVGLHQQHGVTGNSASSASTMAGLGLPIPSPTPHATENPLVEIEFNLWTRPDCAGTPYENQNRTWFHFAVTGGRPNQIVKFNVMNLNKQAKLFSQGMHPVTKVGPNGRWERIKDKPSYSITNDVFYISFLHKAPEVGSEQTKIYYAFTFPFTYTELLDQLATFDRKFGRHPFELNKMAHEISQKYDTSGGVAGATTSTTPTPGDGTKQSSSRRKGKLAKMERIDRTSPESFDETARDGTAIGTPKPSSDASESTPAPDSTGAGLQKVAKREPSGMVIDENTSESMQQITNLVNKVKIELPQGGGGPVASSSSSSSSTSSCSKLKLPSFHQQLSSTSNSTVNVAVPTTTTDVDDSKGVDQRDEIYYCRELLTHSVEHRRIELLTISSFHGIQPVREPRLRNLFPDEQAQRCHTFRDKKIVFISSRVHPGETPASFVLNGFLSMLLDRKSIVSQTLRRMYVFKVIPFLNPDGVYNGLYRSDTRGHNLNRVYLGPCHETQPAIYAARKLIRYYHLGTDEVEPYELEQEKKSSSPESIHPVAVGGPSNTVPSQSEQSTVEGAEGSTNTTVAPLPTSAGTNTAVAVKKESDSIEQDTPLASDSGFSETSTSSKVVTMSSISSGGSPVGEPEEGVQQEQTATTASVTTTDSSLGITINTTTTTTAVANPTLAPTKAFTEKLIPELNPIVSEAPPAASVRPAIAGRSASSLSIVSTGSKKSVQAKVDSGKTGKGAFHKQHHSLNKPQFIGVTPTGGGTLKLKDCIIHHHHHHHHHHHALHHHHHHTGASAAAIGSVGGGGTAGPKLALGTFKKGASSKQQQSGQSVAPSSCCSSIIGTGGGGGGGGGAVVRTATGERILGETMGGKSRPQTPQTQPLVTVPSASSSLLYGSSGSHYRSHRNEYLNPGGGPQRQLNISLDFLTQQLDERNERMVIEDRSNLFMYLDLHGHASKKGVFMYGNHLPSTAEAVECMLLPRLMSLNSQHFHFDACNFSERNMYYKGKRDGLSKEGSGRVAVYKCTGLIKSYTLECNYNTGKCVNILPARGKEIVAKATHTLVPPKYTPGVFEEVGRALGPSILDLTNSNPLSRLPNCEFRTLQGLRNALRIEIERGSSKARVTNKGPKGTHAKRLANQLSNSIEISKENAIQWANASNALVVGGVPGAATCIAAIGGQGIVPGNATTCGATGATVTATNVVKVIGDELQSAGGPSLVSGVSAVTTGSTGVGRNTFLKAGSTVSHGKAGKIARKGGAGVFGKKKQKVLCDVSGGVTGTGAAVVSVPGSGKKLQELVLRTTKDQQQQQTQQQQHQVPRKKIKVSGVVGVGSGSVGTAGGPIASGLELCFKGTFGNVVGSSSLPNFLTAVPGAAVVAPSVITAKKVKSESKLLDVDDMQCDDSFDAAPCCSYGTGTGSAGGGISGGAVTDAELLMVAGGSPSLIDVTSATTASSDSSNGGATAGKCRKSNTIGTMTGTSTVGTAKAKKQPKLAKSTKSTGGDASKKLLKKKRSLKSDSTGLKRKKTRIKPALT